MEGSFELYGHIAHLPHRGTLTIVHANDPDCIARRVVLESNPTRPKLFLLPSTVIGEEVDVASITDLHFYTAMHGLNQVPSYIRVGPPARNDHSRNIPITGVIAVLRRYGDLQFVHARLTDSIYGDRLPDTEYVLQADGVERLMIRVPWDMMMSTITPEMLQDYLEIDVVDGVDCYLRIL